MTYQSCTHPCDDCLDNCERSAGHPGDHVCNEHAAGARLEAARAEADRALHVTAILGHGASPADLAAIRVALAKARADALDEAADLLRDMRETFDDVERKSIVSGETAVRLLARAARSL